MWPVASVYVCAERLEASAPGGSARCGANASVGSGRLWTLQRARRVRVAARRACGSPSMRSRDAACITCVTPPLASGRGGAIVNEEEGQTCLCACLGLCTSAHPRMRDRCTDRDVERAGCQQDRRRVSGQESLAGTEDDDKTERGREREREPGREGERERTEELVESERVRERERESQRGGREREGERTNEERARTSDERERASERRERESKRATRGRETATE
eukprot:6181471-Pleurochrysis_carterae.AAC.1